MAVRQRRTCSREYAKAQRGTLLRCFVPSRGVSRLALLTVCFLAESAAAQTEYVDRVVLQGTTASSRVTMQCEILDYNGERIVFRTATTKTEQRFPASQVVTVKTRRMPPHNRGLDHLKAGKFPQAEAELSQALNEEPRRWVRREIRADLIRCCLQQCEYGKAGNHFRRLYDEDPETRHVRLIPLVWDNVAVNEESIVIAAAWLQDKKSVMRLIGASLLLDDRNYGEAAKDTLRALAKEPGKRVRLLAGWQERRLKLRNGEVTDLEMARLETLVEELETDLRPGPWYLVGRAHVIRQEFDLASAAFLRLPISHNTDHPMTPRAMFNAARALEQIGFRNQSRRLDQEVIDRYAWSPAARLSRQAIQQPVRRPATDKPSTE